MFSCQTISSMTDAEWWKGFFAINTTEMSNKALLEILALMTAVASSSGIKRVFSRFGLVHSKLCNKLGVEKANKLVRIYQSNFFLDSGFELIWLMNLMMTSDLLSTVLFFFYFLYLKYYIRIILCSFAIFFAVL